MLGMNRFVVDDLSAAEMMASSGATDTVAVKVEMTVSMLFSSRILMMPGTLS